MKSVVFIGNRPNVYRSLQKLGSKIQIVKAYALADSPLQQEWKKEPASFQEFFQFKERQHVLQNISNLEFDILISNGCPFIIPVSSIKKPHQLFLNIHPTPLPFLKGKTPINGYFYNQMKFFGVTVHEMNDGIDTGPIVHQRTEPLTEDIDLGLLYNLVFEMEGSTFLQAWKMLEEKDFQFESQIQKQEGSIFNRTPEMQNIDLQKDTTEIILRKIRSFGISSQGIHCVIEDSGYSIWEADLIFNTYVLQKFASESAGKIVLFYQDYFLLKTIDGLIKVKRFKKQS